MIIRKYRPEDCRKLYGLFYDTVHAVNIKDYTSEQVNAWAPDDTEPEKWSRSFSEHFCLVAETDKTVIGFGDIDKTGYLDRLYVHKDYQRQGVATVLCDELEQAVPGKVITHASVTARPFFEKRGYQVVREQRVERRGILLVNFVMEKNR